MKEGFVNTSDGVKAVIGKMLDKMKMDGAHVEDVSIPEHLTGNVSQCKNSTTEHLLTAAGNYYRECVHDVIADIILHDDISLRRSANGIYRDLLSLCHETSQPSAQGP